MKNKKASSKIKWYVIFVISLLVGGFLIVRGHYIKKSKISVLEPLELSAVITSSEVRCTGGSRGYIALCANFDILDKNDKILSTSYQCGRDWKTITEGIRYQLREQQKEINYDIIHENEVQRLNHIKNDKIGYKIGGGFVVE